MNKTPLIYIIMPCYNAENYLLEQLMSIYYQNYTNWYLIFINDWSTDSSEQIIRERISHYNLFEKVMIITKENGGVNSAVQRWLEEVKNICNIYNKDIFISYCDADDIWSREKLSIQIKYMLMHPEYWLSFHDLSLINENWLLIDSSQLRTIYTKDLSFFYFWIIGNFLTSTSMMFRARYIDLILPMPIWPCIYQDEFTTYVLSLKWINIWFINNQLAYYRIQHKWLLMKSKELYKKQYQSNKHKIFLFLQERFPEEDLSYIINYRYDRFISRSKYWTMSLKVYFLVLVHYPKVFIMLLKINIYKLYYFHTL